VIFFLTVHWKTDYWIEAQYDAIVRTTSCPFEVHTIVDTEIDTTYTGTRSHFGSWQVSNEVSHAVKLDALAELACEKAVSPGDLLVFLDSDALPLDGWEVAVLELLTRHEVVAIERHEFGGDDFSHPSFCVLTVSDWVRAGGQWSDRASWENSNGTVVRKVGSGLSQKFLDSGMSRHALKRSNKIEFFPPFFAVYGDIVYHHTAGSYPKQAHRNVQQSLFQPKLLGLSAKFLRLIGSARLSRSNPWRLLNQTELFVRASVRGNSDWPARLVSKSHWLRLFTRARGSVRFLPAKFFRVYSAHERKE